MRPIPFLLVLAAGLAAPAARAAESYDSCTGTIASLPATLTTPGTWCLAGDLSTTLASGNAILVDTNNVTVDCNGFKLGNLAAGEGTQTVGIRASVRVGVAVRGCNVRGFRTAIRLTGSRHLIEDNRIEASRVTGILVSGDGMIVRRNQVFDTGGQTDAAEGIVFAGTADIHDNIVDGLFPDPGASSAAVYGIRGDTTGAHFTIRGNVIRGLDSLGLGGTLIGISVRAGFGDVVDNTLSAVDTAPAPSYAIVCIGDEGYLRDNRATGFDVLAVECPPGSGNVLLN